MKGPVKLHEKATQIAGAFARADHSWSRRLGVKLIIEQQLDLRMNLRTFVACRDASLI